MKKIVIAVFIIFIAILIIFFLLTSRRSLPQTGETESPDINVPTGFRNSGGALPTTVKTNNDQEELVSSGNQPTLEPYEFNQLTQNTPFENEDFSLSYIYEIDKFLFEKKTDKADAAAEKWAKDLNISDAFNKLKKMSDKLLVKNVGDKSFLNQAITTLPQSEQTNLNQLINKLPKDTPDFAVDYSPATDTFFVEIKTINGQKELDKWAKEQKISEVINNPNIFKPTTKLIAREKEIVESKAVKASPSAALETKKNAAHILLELMSGIYSGIASSSSLIGPLPSINTPQSPFTTPNPQSGGTNTDDNTEVMNLIKSYGLPPPKESEPSGKGYNNLKAKIQGDQRAVWATKQMLAAERAYESKNPTANGLPKLNRYLTTAWLWWENDLWPDPYEINCDDKQNLSTVSTVCRTNNFQVAGYQAATRKNDYMRVYNFLYKESDLQSILNSVIANSDNAIRNTWKYDSSFRNTISNATLRDIAPNSDFFNERTQKITLMLGKDPQMAVGLNTFAVSEGDLIRQLRRTDGCPYGSRYYCGSPQVFSNMIAALYLVDTGSSSLTQTQSSGSSSGSANSSNNSSVTSWAQQIGTALESGSSCGGIFCRLTKEISNFGYSASRRLANNTGTTSTGQYWCTTLVIDSYNLAGKKGLVANSSHESVIEMIKYWRSNDNYLDYSGGNKQSVIKQVNPGCAMFQESVHGVHTGREHASIVTEVELDSRMNGHISTVDANAPKQFYKFVVDEGVVKNWAKYPYVSFGC